MRIAFAVAMLAWAAQFSTPACADLYRWVDPESGSVKFSNYAPPWYNESAPDRRMPKVERIPERSASKPVGSASAPASTGVSVQDALEGQRRAVLLMIEATLDEPDSQSEAELQRQMGIYRDVTARLDRQDPAGRDARARELQRFSEKLGRGLPQ